MSLAILTDSASNLYKELLERYDIGIVSFKYETAGIIKKCYDPNSSYEKDGEAFYGAMRNGIEFRTSLVNPNEYIEFFRKYLEKGMDILYVSLSAGLSSTYSSSNTAKNLLQEEFPERRIECFNPMSASFGQAISAIKASEMRQEGKSLDEILRVLTDMRLHIRNEFTVDDLVYLKRGGRISALVYQIGKMLNIKVLLRASREGTIESFGKVMGRKKALLKLVDGVKNNIINPESQTLYLAHCDCKAEAEKVKDMLFEAIPTLQNVIVSMYDFCTGAHVGPGTIALFYYGKERD